MDNDTQEFYSLHEAALGLSAALKSLDAIEADRGRFAANYSGLPLHMEQERDRAVSRVRAAVRYLYNETD